MSNGQDVGDVYNATLERIRTQGEGRARLGMDAIMWIAYSERPLEPDELCQALGVAVGSTDLDNDNAPSIRTILNCGLGLVTVDSSSSKVRLVHFTLQEHILANPTLFYNPHCRIAEVCLTYLNFRCIEKLSPSLPSPPPTTPFLDYASRYWGAHCRRETSPSVNQLAVKLLDRFDSHIFCKLFLDAYLKRFIIANTANYPTKFTAFYANIANTASHPTKFTALHAGALLGVVEIMILLLKMDKWDLNATDKFGMTASLWATWTNHDAIVKVLVEQGSVDPRHTDHWGNGLLLCAAWAGSGAVVRVLLERGGVDPDTTDEGGRTPLSWAAGPTFLEPCTEEGCGRAATILLERNDVDLHRADESGRGILLRITENGREKIILMRAGGDLCSHGSSRGAKITVRWTKLGQHEETVRILLGRSDVNPDRADKHDRTPLSWAAEYGYEESVQMLLERNDVNPNSADKCGRTPLLWAAKNWHWKIVRMLLERNDVHPDCVDERGRTPLSWAAEYGREEIARMLLERDNVNLHSVDKTGLTPLSWAAKNGHEEIVGLLSQRNNAHPDTVDESGQTLFPWPTENDYESHP